MNRAAWLFRRIRIAKPRRRANLQLTTLEGREVPSVSGTVFRDYDQDGTIDSREPGVESIQVRAVNAAGTVVETVSTNAAGQYTLTTSLANVRVELGTLPSFLQPGRVAGSVGESIRFVNASTNPTGVNFGVNNPADFSQANPAVVLTRHAYDEQRTSESAGSPVIVSIPYGADTATPTQTTLATAQQVGTTFGLAYQRQSDSLYASSFMRRHAGFGPNANNSAVTTGAIYRVNRTNGTVTLLIDFNNLAGLPGGFVPAGSFGTGANPHPVDPEILPNGNPATPTATNDWFHDANSFAQVGKISLGDLDISEDGRTLYSVNLATRELIEIPITLTGTLDTTRSLRRTAVPLINPTAGLAVAEQIQSFNSGDLRPFAVAVKDGVVYVGVTYTAQTSGGVGNLRAFVYAFDSATGQFRSFDRATNAFNANPLAPVLISRLDYARTNASGPPNRSALWRPWTDTFGGQNLPTGTVDPFLDIPTKPQPWLTDIAFDNDRMILGIRDRFGDQGGFQTGNLITDLNDPDSSLAFDFVGAGDTLRAQPSGTGWSLESNGSDGVSTSGGAGTGQGPGNGEFYFQDSLTIGGLAYDETTAGAVVQVPGLSTVVVNGVNLRAEFTGGVYTFRNVATGATAAEGAGTTASRAQIYDSLGADIEAMGAGNGIGGLEVLSQSAAIQVGNRVFRDLNSNGIQDADELGISGVAVGLFRNNVQVGTDVTTDAAGQFLFDNLAPNTTGEYQLRINLTQSALTGLNLVTADQGVNDLIDSDATASTGFARIDFNTGDAGSNNHSLDFGFSGTVTPPVGTVAVGDRVFRDLNNNGLFDTGETGIANVAVELRDSTGATLVASTTTDGTGQYLFNGRAPGDYLIRLVESNFIGAGVLAGLTSSTGNGNVFEGASTPDPNAVPFVDNDDNGQIFGTLGQAGGYIESRVVSLAVGQEPVGDGDQDANTNRTVDFGLTTANSSIAGRVFTDFNNNGTFNGPDAAIAGVTITLTGGNLAAPRTTTTDAQGNYSFTGLLPGTYALAETQPVTPANDDGRDVVGSAGGNNSSNDQITAIVLGSNVNATGYNFAEVPRVSLGGKVYEDLNGNGLFDTGETAIGSATVRLTGTSILTGAAITPIDVLTNSGGDYVFNNLAPGTYSITETQPADFADGLEQNATTFVATVGNDVFSGIDLTTSSASGIGFNFGETRGASLAGTVFNDVDGNGTLGAGDTGIAGVTVTLTGTNDLGLSVSQSVVTNAQGQYQFASLRPGTYVLTESQPSTFADGLESFPTGGGTSTVNDQIAGIQLVSGASATGYNFGELARADLSITQAISRRRIRVGETVDITITLRNIGSADAANGFVNVNLGGLQFVSASSTDYNSATGRWSIANLAINGTTTLRLTVRADSTGRFVPTSTAAGIAQELSSLNNTATGSVSAGPLFRSVTGQAFLSSRQIVRRVSR